MNARKISLTAIECDLAWSPQVDIRQGVQMLFESFTNQAERELPREQALAGAAH